MSESFPLPQPTVKSHARAPQEEPSSEVEREFTGEPVEDDRIPIMWHSNAPWTGTGYGMQTGLFGPRIAEQLGYRLAFSSFYGLQGSRIGWNADTGKGYVVYPAGRDVYGNDVMGAHYSDWARGKKGLWITLTDPWVLHTAIVSKLPALAWIPVDHAPLIPRTEEWLWRTEAIPLAMSKWGKAVIEEKGLNAMYVPHGFNPDIFYPQDREKARDFFQIPQDAFVVGMVAANKGAPSRKGFAQAISAFARFKEKHPEALLYLHTQLESPDGENLVALCENARVYPMSSDQYKYVLGQPPTLVSGLMNSFDVMLNPATGEGFGVPLIEAQACGTPTIVTNFSAMPEVAPDTVGNWFIEGEPLWTAFESWQQTPKIDSILACLEAAYSEATQDRIARRASVANWALEEYAVDHIVQHYWKPVLREALARIAFMDKRMQRHVTE